MCRLLAIRSEKPFPIQEHLEKFARICKHSKEFQGHGWGIAYKTATEEWCYYKNIKPLWEDDVSQFTTATTMLCHARSAFEDKDIIVENNMPFYDEDSIFIFNGELRGVKIREEGRIGAEKIYNHINRFHKKGMEKAFEIAMRNITNKTDYVRAMNIILWNEGRFYINQQYNEDAEYFTLRTKLQNSMRIICSEMYPGEKNWEKFDNHTIRIL